LNRIDHANAEFQSLSSARRRRLLKKREGATAAAAAAAGRHFFAAWLFDQTTETSTLFAHEVVTNSVHFTFFPESSHL
jgi:hypothetical protein